MGKNPSPAPQPREKHPARWTSMSYPSGGKGRLITRGQGCGDPRRTRAALAPGDTLNPRRWVAQFVMASGVGDAMRWSDPRNSRTPRPPAAADDDSARRQPRACRPPRLRGSDQALSASLAGRHGTCQYMRTNDGVVMVPVPLSELRPSRDEAIEEWPWLDEDVLRSSRCRQVCMTCHFFRHHPGPNCIPQLSISDSNSSQKGLRLGLATHPFILTSDHRTILALIAWDSHALLEYFNTSTGVMVKLDSLQHARPPS